MNKSELKKYLIDLGLEAEEASLYMALIEKGGGTPLSLSRQTGINRTRVYRLLERMAVKKLIAQEVGEHTTLVTPAPIDQLQEILLAKQNKVAELSKKWSEAASTLEQSILETKAETKVKFYHGKTGIEQMVWNVLKAKDGIVGYTFRDLSHFVGEKFMTEFSEEFKRRNLKMRDIHGDEYLSSKPIDNNWGDKIDSRYLPREVLAIPHQMEIYDDVVTFYSWNEGEVWGTEIHNPKVAQMQRQLFEMAWEKAKKS